MPIMFCNAFLNTEMCFSCSLDDMLLYFQQHILVCKDFMDHLFCYWCWQTFFFLKQAVMKENKSKFPKSSSEIKLFPCPPAADDFCKQVSHKSNDMWSYRSKATQLLWLSSCCSSHGCRSHLSSFIQAARCRSEKQRGACVFSYIMLLQYLIRIASSVTVSVTLQNKKQTPQHV